jgi:hypothetical protein
MRITFLVDLRSPIAIQRIQQFVEREHQVQVISYFRQCVLRRRNDIAASRGFQVLGGTGPPVRNGHSGRVGSRREHASRSGQPYGGWSPSGASSGQWSGRRMPRSAKNASLIAGS